MHTIRVHEHGGPEVLRWEEVDTPTPGAGEVLIRHSAIGLNFIDVYFRTGLYAPPSMPFTPGMEAAGVVEAVGPGVQGFERGQRVAYATPPAGAYCEQRVMPASRLLPLPDAIDDATAAGMMLKGMTAYCLLRRTYPVQPGETILVHAAAGGVGTLLCQWAKQLGAQVIGTVGSAEKAEYARAHGCDHPIVYTEENFPERVREITGGQGVPVVYDSVGKATFAGSLDCLRPLGTMVCFGQSSGSVAPLDIGVLAAKGSLFLTRPTLFTYVAERSALEAAAGELMDMVASGRLRIEVEQRWPLEQVAEAHRELERRQTRGATVLLI